MPNYLFLINAKILSNDFVEKYEDYGLDFTCSLLE